MRYELKKGKFGCYFYDSEHSIDLTLEMVMNKLNDYELRIKKGYTKLNNLRKKIYELKKDD